MNSYPAFVSNEHFFTIDASKNELERALGMAENLKKILVVTNSKHNDFDDLISDYLDIGLEIFSMQIGIVSKIVGQDYIICNAVSPDNSITKGDVFVLQDTYCREVCRSKSVLGFPHVGRLAEMKDHPVYVNMKLEAYISAPIYVFDQIYGTLNFTSTTPRENGFSEHERDLISLMADSIGSFLELNDKEIDLKKTNDRLKQLVGFVAHDLRGPLGNIKALSGFVSHEEDKDRLARVAALIGESAEHGTEMVHTILESAAMGSGKIELNIEKTNLTPIINHVKENHVTLAKQKQIEFVQKISDDLEAEVDVKRMHQVFNNIFSNAVKYTPKQGNISLEVSRRGSKIEFQLRNSLDPEITKFKRKNRDLSQSVGFGLEIVREILRLHDSKLEITVADNMYNSRFLLPTFQ